MVTYTTVPFAANWAVEVKTFATPITTLIVIVLRSVDIAFTPVRQTEVAVVVFATAIACTDKIAVGKRADLVLVGGNPVDNIAATENVKRVWIEGEEVMLE